MLFHKEPSPFEVFNDFNADLVNLYRCIRDKPEKLIQRLEYTLNAREDFEHIRKLLKSKAELTDIQRAAGYYQLIRQSYASTLDSFGGQPTGMWATFPVIRQAAERLQRVVIDNRDFEKVIGQYDRENSLFYCDRRTGAPRIIMRMWCLAGKIISGWRIACWGYRGDSCCPTTTATRS